MDPYNILNATYDCIISHTVPSLLHPNIDSPTGEENAGREEHLKGIYYNGTLLSYEDLNKNANLMARSLHSKFRETLSLRASRSGSEGGDSLDSFVEFDEEESFMEQTEKRYIIAVDIEHGHTLVTALLAILKLGAAYMPIDSTSAINRVSNNLHRCC